jgi:hypothetical protein
MKKLIIIAFAAVCIFPAAAQERNNPETLIQGDISSGGYGGVDVKGAQIKGKNAVLIGGRGGWIVNSTFILGGGGYGMVSQLSVDSIAGVPGASHHVEFGYGGLILSYMMNSDKLVHLAGHVLVGAGGVSYKEYGMEDDEHHIGGVFSTSFWPSQVEQHSVVFVLEPSAEVELNISEHIRAALGASYRYVSGVTVPNLKDSDFSGAQIQFGMKFGNF